MANVDWQGFLRGIRESIETIRTPIDPIAIQGTAAVCTQSISVEAGEDGIAAVYPPSDGYNRATVVVNGIYAGDADIWTTYNQPQQSFERAWYSIVNPLTGAHINPINSVGYTIEIPDRNCGIEMRYHNSLLVPMKPRLDVVFWRQY